MIFLILSGENMAHHTKDKGDLAVVKTMADLTEKGYIVFTTISEHLPFDLIAYDKINQKSIRIQVKHSKTGFVKPNTGWSDKTGYHFKMYNNTDFDYYAIYLPDKNVICYPSIKFMGVSLRFELPKSATPFYWYEDFLDFTDNAEKKNFIDLGISLLKPIRKKLNKTSGRIESIPRPHKRKVVRPSKEELLKMIWEKPMVVLAKEFGVSDKAIAKWIKAYGIEKPPIGYWAKKAA